MHKLYNAVVKYLHIEMINKNGGYLLWQEENSNRVLLRLSPELYLGKDLICEGVAHNETWMAHGTTQIHQPTLSQ